MDMVAGVDEREIVQPPDTRLLFDDENIEQSIIQLCLRWIAQTHSWVDPTALCLIALRVAGQGGHERVKEGERMILYRQLADGGWNYGNTRVFGQKLHPMPESTGLALCALAERVSRAQVALSVTY